MFYFIKTINKQAINEIIMQYVKQQSQPYIKICFFNLFYMKVTTHVCFLKEKYLIYYFLDV